jgi:hypothetical protein
MDMNQQLKERHSFLSITAIFFCCATPPLFALLLRFGGSMTEITRISKAICAVLAITALLSPCQSAAQELNNSSDIPPGPRVVGSDSDACVDGARSIHELTPQLALNDFDGRSQTVAGLVYSFSRCIGRSGNRWFVEASAAHVDEPGFSANAGLAGVGLEWRPFRHSAPYFALIPVIRAGREEYRGSGGATVFDAAVTASNVIPLRFQSRPIDGQNVSVAVSQLELAARAEYVSRDPSRFLSASQQDNDGLVFFGSIGLDQAIGRSNWRWKGSLSYQTLTGGGSVNGIASLRLAFRIVNPAYTNYDWNFAITAQRGDGGFTGFIFAISKRFSH